ncbi:MAG: RNA polymerase sigma-70 factor [Carboxylicivirga sp.]|jgi:RNA polymerase sigma-70 factor (ECF subfamily)|nr:RNA polymerase sigma-70 factor [Carboxylicivirga sp.]
MYTPLFLDKIRKKDQKSFEKLYYDLFAPLVVFANKYVHDDGLSEDIVQEIMISLWSNSTKVNIHSSLKSYLYTAVRNSAINHLEKKAVAEKHIEKHLAFENKTEEDHLLLSRDVYRQVHNTIKNLPKKSREVIIMSLNEMSLAEIGEELNVSINTVKSNKRRAYIIFREIFRKKIKKKSLLF